MKIKSYPVCMKGIPFFGNILQFLKAPRDFFIDCSLHYGPIFRVRTPLGFVTIIAGKLGKNLLKKEIESGFTRIGLFQAFSKEVGVDIFEESGEQHKSTRKFVMLPYSRMIISQFTPEIEKSVRVSIEVLNQDQEFELFQFCTEITLHAVMSSVTPIELRDLTKDFYPYADRVMDIVMKRYPQFTSKFPIYKRRKNAVHTRIDEVINRHLVGEFQNDPKMYLVDAALKNAGKNPELHVLKNIRGICIYMLSGSVVYTTRLVFFTIFQILKNKALHEKILKEIDAAFGDGDLDPKMIRKMPILRSTYMEVLRMYPLLPGLPFKTSREITIEGWTLPKGEDIIFIPHSEHFLEENYKDAYHFHPLRFLQKHNNKVQHDCFFPHGVADRVCPAAGAMEVLTIMLTTIFFRQNNWTLVSPAQEFELKLNPLIGPDRPIMAKKIGLRDCTARVADKDTILQSVLSEDFDFNTYGARENDEQEITFDLDESCLVTYQDGNFIVTQGDIADAFYIITQGQVEILVNEVKVSTLHEGNSFGEVGLLKNIPRTATVQAAGVVQVIRIPKEEFIKMIVDFDLQGNELGEILKKRFLEIKIQQSLPGLHGENLGNVLKEFHFKNFKKGEVVIRQGEMGKSIFIVAVGTLEVYTHDGTTKMVLGHISRGGLFGEMGVINQAPRNATVAATSNVTLLELERDYIIPLMKNSQDVSNDIYSLILRRFNQNSLRNKKE